MAQNRRNFLKATGAAGIGSATALGTEATAQPHATGLLQPMPKGLTFCTLRGDRGTTLGIRRADGILDVARAEAALKTGAPTTITALLAGQGNIAALERLAARSDRTIARYLVKPEEAAFGPCVTDPEKIICVGLNYRAHAAEANQRPPEVPILFNKYNSSLNHHNGVINISREHATRFDYEAELCIVMGREARDVSEADALSYVFGYCCGQDFSVRDLQSRTTQWMVGKAGDGWGPLGPWLVTADQVDPDKLKIEGLVNGEVRQSSNTSMLIHNCRKLISYSSMYMTLKPGDVIFTGTPEGVIAGYPRDRQVWLKRGDTLTVRIEKLGEQLVTLV